MPENRRIRNTADVCRALRAAASDCPECGTYAKIVAAEHAELLRKLRAEREARAVLDRGIIGIGRDYPETVSAVESARSLAAYELDRKGRGR